VRKRDPQQPALGDLGGVQLLSHHGLNRIPPEGNERTKSRVRRVRHCSPPSACSAPRCRRRPPPKCTTSPRRRGSFTPLNASCCEHQTPSVYSGSAALSPSGRLESGVAEEARTGGFASRAEQVCVVAVCRGEIRRCQRAVKSGERENVIDHVPARLPHWAGRLVARPLRLNVSAEFHFVVMHRLGFTQYRFQGVDARRRSVSLPQRPGASRQVRHDRLDAGGKRPAEGCAHG
jgi:hypothetical protein